MQTQNCQRTKNKRLARPLSTKTRQTTGPQAAAQLHNYSRERPQPHFHHVFGPSQLCKGSHGTEHFGRTGIFAARTVFSSLATPPHSFRLSSLAQRGICSFLRFVITRRSRGICSFFRCHPERSERCERSRRTPFPARLLTSHTRNSKLETSSLPTIH